MQKFRSHVASDDDTSYSYMTRYPTPRPRAMTTSSTEPYLCDDAELAVIWGVLVEPELAPPALDVVAPAPVLPEPVLVPFLLPLPLPLLPVPVAFPDGGETPAGTEDVETLAVVEFGAAADVVPAIKPVGNSTAALETVETVEAVEAVEAVEEPAAEEPAAELGLDDEPHLSPSLEDLMLPYDPVWSVYV